jgi:hypothetical protein
MLLVDVEHGLKNLDRWFIDFLVAECRVPFQIVFTKCDLLTANSLAKNPQSRALHWYRKYHGEPQKGHPPPPALLLESADHHFKHVLNRARKLLEDVPPELVQPFFHCVSTKSGFGMPFLQASIARHCRALKEDPSPEAM